MVSPSYELLFGNNDLKGNHIITSAKHSYNAKRITKERLDQLNAKADLMPNAEKAKTADEIYKEYLLHQVSTGEIERSIYSKYIKPYLGDVFDYNQSSRAKMAGELYDLVDI